MMRVRMLTLGLDTALAESAGLVFRNVLRSIADPPRMGVADKDEDRLGQFAKI
jgi:hypothetical protein